MKYTTLKSDIISILHSSDYNLNLRFYDTDGQTTLTPDDVCWGYINNYNIMLDFATDDSNIIYIWKDKNNLDRNMKNIIQRIRKLSVLNGVSVQIRVYDNLDQRKIYNLIKSNIALRKEDEMNESANMRLENALTNMVSIAKNTKKSSDFYMSETIQLNNYKSLLTEMIDEIQSLKGFEKINVKKDLNNLFIASTKEDIKKIVENLDENSTTTLMENIDNIMFIPTFIRQEYLHNVPHSKTNETIMVLENVKVYNAKIKNPQENIIKAYNKLIDVCEGASDKIDLIKHMKNHNILETYGVSKNDLINFWLEQDGKEIKINSAFIIENYMGKKIAYNNSLNFGMKSLAHYFNNGGQKDSQICRNIIAETIKYNDIADFIITYKNDYNLRKYIPKFKELFSESVSKLSSKEFNEALFENFEEQVNYSKEYEDICKKLGIRHRALKYIAEEEAVFNSYKEQYLMEEKNNDAETLVETMKHYIEFPSVVACRLVETSLGLPSINSENELDFAKKLYEEISQRQEPLFTSISSTLFGIINGKKLTETHKKFLQTLKKYC